VRVRPGGSLSSIADVVDDEKVTVESLQRENGILDPDRINAGDQLDVCVGNKIDDITGEKRVPPRIPPLGPNSRGVTAQQQKLNQLFAGYGLPELAVDGDSGPITEQALCAARLALGVPVSRGDMAPGSPEERALMRAESISVPPGAAVDYGRWILIDQTCQTLFAGDGGSLVFVFPTSTGETGYETRNQTASPVFRYDPATENDGWHNSTHYPVPADNPLNGNMYKPLYFDDGQAIHGANNVPTSPASKGCARLPVYSQDALIDWLGLSDVTSPVWDSGNIGVVVTVQGAY
jgi:L,D-transpeptidase catalytic domain/LysM domain